MGLGVVSIALKGRGWRFIQKAAAILALIVVGGMIKIPNPHSHGVT